MVSFICNACGQTVRKNQVEKHYQTVCRQCEVLSCIDCGKDFHGEEYATHTSCISEAEKYQGKLFQPKEKANKGEQKQQEWIKQVQNVSGSATVDPTIKRHLKKLKQYSNVPRKKTKFQNFCKNSVRIYDQSTLDKLWDAFSGGDKTDEQERNCRSGNMENVADQNDQTEEKESESIEKESNDKKTKREDRKKKKKGKVEEEIKEKKKSKKNKTEKQDCEQNGIEKKTKRKRKRDENEQDEPSAKVTKSEENNNTEVEEDYQRQFNWSTVIKKALKEAADNELPVKKLRKKVLAEFMARGDNKPHTDNELRALFEKKLNKNPKIKVKKEIARLCK